MKKRSYVFLLLIPIISVMLSSCTLFAVRIDRKTGFTESLSGVENHIRADNWDQALSNRDEAFEIWHRIKPLLQIDVDHDYVNLIEDYFIMLRAYLETRDKSQALAMLLLIKDTWENIGVM